MLEILIYAIIAVFFMVFNFLLIKNTLHFRELKTLSKQAKVLSDKSRKSIRAGIENVTPISEVKDYKIWNIIIFVAGLSFFVLALYSDEFITSFFLFYCIIPNYLHRGYGMFFEILPNGLILKNRLVKWEEMKSYQLIQITPNHKYYGFDLEINNSIELVIKLGNKRNSIISYTITDNELKEELVSLLQKNGVFEEKNSGEI